MKIFPVYVQIWVGASAVGHDGQLLRCVHKEVSKLEFQDRLGETLVQWCQVVPDGVLAFFPSYSLMAKLIERWKVTVGCWVKTVQYSEVGCAVACIWCCIAGM